MMRKSKIPTFLGILILTFGLGLGVFLVQGNQIFKIGANPTEAPKEVEITNVGDSSLTVSWTTDKKTAGFVKWGDSANLPQVTPDDIGELSFTHSVTLTGLKPQTSYFFKIGSGSATYDKSGANWEAKTGAHLAIPRQARLMSGIVLGKSGDPLKNALVYISIAGVSPLSTFTSDAGAWAIPISLARSEDLSSYAKFDPKTTLSEIKVAAGPVGAASAKIFPAAGDPTPPIILGGVHDFRNVSATASGELPKAKVELPKGATPSSKFNVPENVATPPAKTVTLRSLEQGETVTSIKPEFFGEGPVGTTITISVQSQAVSTQIKVGPSGTWKWNLPTSLSEGTHTITITWKDATGIQRTLTRTFVVQAAEGPAFVATPSGSPTASPKASPTSTPKATATPKLSPTPTPSGSAIPTPQTGSLTPTILLTIMGIGVLIASFIIWEVSDKPEKIR